MNKKMLFCCTVLIILLFVMVIVACTPDSKTDCEITSATGFTINETTLSIKVPNQQDSFSFSNSITVSQNANWYVSTDIEGNNQIPSGTVSLQVGDNIFYINITSGNGSSKKQYTANIRRREIYTVTYEPNNGEQSIVLKIEEDGKINNQTVEKHGFTLDGWLYGDKFWDFENDTIKNNTVLTAAWSGKQYTVSFDTNVEENIPSVEVTCGNLYQFETVEKEHYQFLGWAYNNIMLTDENGNSLTKWFIADNITVTACWEPVKYQLYYENIFEAENANPQYYTIESENIHLLTPYRLGYDFIGWTENDELIYDIPSGTYGNKILKANWEEINYTISYENIDNATNDNPTVYNINSNVIILNQAERAGYDFLGWFDDGNNQVIEIPTGTYGNIKLSAKWEMIVYNVTYHLDGGINSGLNKSSYTIEDLGGADKVIPLYSATKADTLREVLSYKNGAFNVEKSQYDFEGWYSDVNFNNKLTEISLGITDIYAKWHKIDTITTEQIYTMENNVISFGNYPQTRVTDTETLKELGDFNINNWHSYPYYIENVQSEFMYYIDKTLNGQLYRGVYFKSYRPNYISRNSNVDNSSQDNNGYFKGIVYWFKYEPVQWKIVDSTDNSLKLVSQQILDSKEFNSLYSNANDYNNSTIKNWLNDVLYYETFNDIEKIIINSFQDANAKYNYLSLMSYNQAIEWFPSSSDLHFQGTDYAKCQGLNVSSIISEIEYSDCWLLSPNENNSYEVNYIYSGGAIYNRSVYYTNMGILPVLEIHK